MALYVWSPNIVGYIDAESEGCGIAEGAFYRVTAEISNYPAQGQGWGDRVGFDASLCSTEYVTGANLQVSALQTLACIKL